eukprot:123813_1
MSLRRSNRFKNKTFNYHATRIDTGPILPSKKNAQNEKNELYVFGHDDDMKMVENKSDAQEPNEESGSQPAIPDAQSFNLSTLPRIPLNIPTTPTNIYAYNPYNDARFIKQQLYQHNGMNAILGERNRIFTTTMQQIGYRMYSTLSTIGVTNPTKNIKLHQCDKLVWEDAGKPLVSSLYAAGFEISGKIEKYYNFNWNSCKKLFGGVHAISRKAEDERPGYYHLCFVNMIQWSGNNRNITVNYKVKYSERLDDGSYAQYAAH